MKQLLITITIILMLLFLALTLKAASLETTFGGLTYHTMNPDGVANGYANKISSDGTLIYTGLLGVGLVNGNWTGRVFIGQNSIGDQIFGSTISYTWELNSRLRLGPVIGYYQQDDSKYILKGIKPFSLGFGLVPIVGAEFTAKILTFDDNKYIKLNTILTPVLLNETISFGVDL